MSFTNIGESGFNGTSTFLTTFQDLYSLLPWESKNIQSYDIIAQIHLPVT
jgi:hypothetical protein